MLQVLAVEVSFILAAVGIIWFVGLLPVIRERRHRKDPFSERTLRPAGESLRLEVLRLHDKIDDCLFGLFVPVSVSIGFFLGRSTRPGGSLEIFLESVSTLLLTVLVSIRLRGLVRERSDMELGFEGERQTAQHLIDLVAKGYRVFHDVPFKTAQGSPFNIDHVLTGPAGVIVVETKAHRKHTNLKNNYKVRHDGKALHFPNFSDESDLNQAEANARSLGEELLRRTGEKVEVHPILVLPGWLIDRPPNGARVAVLNSKEVTGHVASLGKSPLSEKLLGQINGFLIEKTEIEPDAPA